MANDFVPFPLNFKEAIVLADLQGIKQDLEWIIQAGNKYIELNKLLNDPLLLEALFFAFIARYGRTHQSGARTPIPKIWIKALSSTQQIAHKYFMDLRNKHVAHSVNN